MAQKLSGDPNLSIVLPGPCQAKCEFCYWSEQKASDRYMDQLRNMLSSLPSEYRRVTITGGEPTISKYLEKVVRAVREREWDAVVLTTNGVLLDKYLDLPVDHVNLSRHHHSTQENQRIFDGVVPGNAEVTVLASWLNERGVDVTWSCVLCGQFESTDDIQSFIMAANGCNASAVMFRADQRQHSTGRPRELEWMSKWKVSDRWSCEACKTWRQIINGTPVLWKASIPEPSVQHQCEYELIFHPDGRLTLDWAGKLEKVGDMIRVKKDGITFECDTVEEALAIAGVAGVAGEKQKERVHVVERVAVPPARCGGGIGLGGRCGL